MTDFTEMMNLAAERLGAAVLAVNDEFFAPKEALLKPTEPEWREGAYTERGKWMDGWETRRRHGPGYDWAVIRLGVPGVLHGIEVNTAFFRGNYPEEFSLEACEHTGVPSMETLASSQWTEIVPRTRLEGNTANRFALDDGRRWTHLRLKIFPDGGVARLRVYGVGRPDYPAFVRQGGEMDLAAMENGGWVETCSDRFYGHPQNMLLPGRSLFMGDGWETQRRRTPGSDWTIVRLAVPGRVHRVEIDTDHFKGNAPDRAHVEGLYAPGMSAEELAASDQWRPMVPGCRLLPHSRHRWEAEVADIGPVTHVRLTISPDGGVARMRVYGTLVEPAG